MALLDWFDDQRRRMDFICTRAEELRAQYGEDAEEWCETRFLSAQQPAERRAMKQLRKALRHIP